MIRNITQGTAIEYAAELIEYLEVEIRHFCKSEGCDAECTFEEECACRVRSELKRFIKRETNYTR